MVDKIDIPKRKLERLRVPKLRHHPRNRSAGEEPYIPLIGHYVWLSDPSEPIVLSSANSSFDNIWNNINLLNQDEVDWQFTFWTN